MNNLLLGLSIAGGVVLAGVIAHGAWTARKSAPKLAEVDDAVGKHLDVVEPAGLSGLFNAQAHAEPALQTSSTQSLPVEPEFDAKLFDAKLFDAELAAIPAPDKKASLDPLIDVLTAIDLDSPLSGDAILAAMPATRRVGSKPFAVEGLREDGLQDGLVWEAPRAGQRYTSLQAGVQLANRTGALNEIEYSEFVIKTQTFADAVGGDPEFPEMVEEVARARELDAFAAAHDAQLRFVLRAVGVAWSTGYVAQNAARIGFVAGALPGRMVLPNPVASLPQLITLMFDSQAAMSEDASQSAIRELTLSLEVSHVARTEQPFARMRECAKALATAMDGRLCDDQGYLMTESALDGLAVDIERLYDALDERDLSAGSMLARRLFS
jgi:ZipA, C-terminal FtsZ-binding domain